MYNLITKKKNNQEAIDKNFYFCKYQIKEGKHEKPICKIKQLLLL